MDIIIPSMLLISKRLLLVLILSGIYSLVFSQEASIISIIEKKSRKNEPVRIVKPYVHPSYVPDKDKDGVPDGRDKCPDTPRGVKVTPFGCPMDADFDLIVDYEDDCPHEPGPRANNGCPWGDTDKDGVYDDTDKCPTVPGLRRYGGCPDTDGDGIPDSEDQCPTIPGIREYRGCPPVKKDSDKDGVFDDDDLCPHTPGAKTNKGCPEIKPEDKKVVLEAFDNLLFDFDKATIQYSSYGSLNQLGIVMRTNPEYKLVIEGHTDSIGDSEYNITLSRDRADAIKSYLVEWGISPVRINTYGFGKTRPVAKNNSNDGRQMNRRVELTLKTE